MKKSTKRWLTAATVLSVVGALLFVGVAAALDFDFSQLSTRRLTTNTYEYHKDFEKIFVNVKTATVSIAPSEDGVCRIECVEEEALRHSVKIQAGALKIDAADRRQWTDYIGISFKTPTVTVKLPEEAYTSLCVTTATGDVTVSDKLRFETIDIAGTTSDIACYAPASKSITLATTTGAITMGPAQTDSVEVSATTGRITVNEVSCKNITARSSTAKIHLDDVVARERLCAENTTGGVRLARCDAESITVKTTTGSVKGTLRSGKVFITDTSTGSIRVPQTTSGGTCEIATSTGDIEIAIEQ